MASLSKLPEELLVHIATSGEACSALRLGSTCWAIRKACYNHLVFREILESSQEYHWKDDSLDVHTIQQRAGKDASVWARYAVADYKATCLSGAKKPLQDPVPTSDELNWMLGLLLLKHPLMCHPGWAEPLHQPPSTNFGTVGGVLCYAIAALAQDPAIVRPSDTTASLQIDDLSGFKTGGSKLEMYLWALCSIAHTIPTTLIKRLAIWPFNHMAHVPHIKPPNAMQIPLCNGVPPPLPFRGNEGDRWHEDFSRNTLSDTSYFTDFG